MNTHNEIIHYNNPTLALKIFEHTTPKDKKISGSWHYHKELEILVILEGSMEIMIQDHLHTLQAGDVFLIGPMEVHIDQNLDVHYVVFQFDVHKFFEPSFAPFIHSCLNPHMTLSCLNYIFQDQQSIRNQTMQLVLDIHQEYVQQLKGYEVAISIKIKQILLTILRNDNKEILNHYASLEIERLHPVLTYIANHLDDTISVEHCCQLLNLNYHYFLKLFKKTIGLTFVEYVQHERIRLAERILLTEQISIEEIAIRSGFQNMGHFYKTFHKFHQCTPHMYKKQRNKSPFSHQKNQ